MAAQGRHWEQDKEATVYIGNLDERVNDAMIWELMLQAGRIAGVHLPKDRVTQTHQGFGFVEFVSEEDADYAAKIMNQIRLFGKAIRVNKASADKQKALDVGAELFVGNLDPMADEQTLYETFNRFGTLTKYPSVARDEDGYSKGFAFVSFQDFGAADAAIAGLHGQYLMNKEVTVQYAYKKDGSGQRHGDEAERSLAESGKAKGIQPTVEPINLGVVGAPTGPATNGFPPQVPQGAPPGMPQQNGFGRGGLPPPGTGLPPRPPASNAGYGGPPGYPGAQGGYGGPPPGMPPQFSPVQGGFGGPPPGMPPMQNGYGAPPGMPPPGYPPRR
ncbi:putative spliceosome-associated protein 49 [Elsinoe fawcettii]|nr:putative spliceosome-associated protein 49 [Elsinoe fawcettii]